MSFAKYAQFYKENGFFAGSKIKVTVTDSFFIGQELVLTKGSSVIRSTTIPASGKVDFFTDESGELTLSSNNGTSTISGTVNVTNYGTYNVTLDGEASDTSRQVYASKNSVTLDATHSSDTVSISYTGDIASMSVNSSNTNVATARLNNNIVTITDAGKNIKGTSRIAVTIGATRKYQAKTLNINVTKTNGEIDKSWIGLKNIVEQELEEELCEVGEEYEVTLSNGRSITYVIGAINHDYDHQLIFVPKRYDYLNAMYFNESSNSTWENSSLRRYLNSTFISMLPQDLASVLCQKDIQYAISNTELEQTFDKIWLPRSTEVFNTNAGTSQKETEIYRISRFDCFTDKSVVFSTNTSESDSTFLCSPNAGIPIGYSAVSVYSHNGVYTNQYIQTSQHYGRVLPCFHLIKET